MYVRALAMTGEDFMVVVFRTVSDLRHTKASVLLETVSFLLKPKFGIDLNFTDLSLYCRVQTSQLAFAPLEILKLENLPRKHPI